MINLISLSQLLTLKSIFVNQSMHDHQSMHNQQYLLREITPNRRYFYSEVQMTLKLFSHKTCLNQNHPLRLTITNTRCYLFPSTIQFFVLHTIDIPNSLGYNMQEKTINGSLPSNCPPNLLAQDTLLVSLEPFHATTH